jgi:hypothetical protein
MKKRVGLCIAIVIIALVAAVFFPWEIFTSLKDAILGSQGGYSSLKVYSLAGNMTIFVDGEEMGKVTPEDSFYEVFPIEPGDHEVLLRREASADNFYKDFKRMLHFEKGFDVSISWECGPTDESSSGWVLWAKKGNEDNEYAVLNITCSEEDCLLSIDDSEQEKIPIVRKQLSLDSQHSFKVSKEGYQDLEFQVFSEDESIRKKVAGFDLYVDINLYNIPL